LIWGNHGGREIGMGREWGGGGHFTSNLGPGWTRIAPRKEEGFQVSRRDSGKRGVDKGISKRKWQGEFTRDCAWLSIVKLCICIIILCECS
jgi:hypothetical protein